MKLLEFFLIILLIHCSSVPPDETKSSQICTKECTGDLICFRGLCISETKKTSILNDENNTTSTDPNSPHHPSSSQLTDLVCIPNLETATITIASFNEGCMGIPDACGDKGVCALCAPQCIGESFATCDFSQIPNYENQEISCDDKLDNDCDGKSDCDDENCKPFEICTPPLPDACTFDDALLFEANSEQTCDDGIDNDCDGKLDCADDDCNLNPKCHPLYVWEFKGKQNRDVKFGDCRRTKLFNRACNHYNLDQEFLDYQSNPLPSDGGYSQAKQGKLEEKQHEDTEFKALSGKYCGNDYKETKNVDVYQCIDYVFDDLKQSYETNCGDNKDNDNDGKSDCDDKDCVHVKYCTLKYQWQIVESKTMQIQFGKCWDGEETQIYCNHFHVDETIIISGNYSQYNGVYSYPYKETPLHLDRYDGQMQGTLIDLQDDNSTLSYTGGAARNGCDETFQKSASVDVYKCIYTP